MTMTVGRSRRVLIGRLLRTAYARDRLAAALYDVMADGLDFGPCDLPTVEDREWIRTAIRRPLMQATDEALDGLVGHVTRTFEEAPDGVIERLDRSRRWQELGWE